MEDTQVRAEDGLTRLVEDRGDWLVRCAWLLTHDRERSRDLAQDTLLQAWRAWDKVSAADHPDRYLLRIMLNLHRSGGRRKRVTEVPLATLEAPYDDASLGAVGDLDAVGRAMQHLSERQRAVIVLRYWADLDDIAIAEVLGCRRSTVRSLAARGLKVVETRLAESEEEQ